MLQDNDDGSGYFHTKENVLVYGRYGQKADMAGHDNWHVGVSLCGLAILLLPAFAALTPGGICGQNLYAYVDPLCYCDLGGGEVTNASHRDHHENNTCIQASNQSMYASIRCDANGTEDVTQPYFRGNKIFNPNGQTGVCGMSLEAWQALGNDPGTTVHGPIPPADSIISMARKTLGM